MRINLLLAAVVLSMSCKPSGSIDDPVLKVAREYVSYGRVDDANRWSPALCLSSPSVARLSESGDAATHGRKLYYLFAKDREAYIHGFNKPQPIGQVIVKEAWKPRVMGEREKRIELQQDEGGHYSPYASLEGRTYTTSEKSGLFIMIKTGPDEPENQEWMYATVTADGKRVIQAGKIPSCIGCHRDAKPDSLFGIGQKRDK